MVQILLRQQLQYSERERLGEHLIILIDIAIIYPNTEFKHSGTSIFRNSAFTNIKNYHTHVIQVCTVGIEERFSGDKIQK
jgi:hypothetical protein